MRVEHLSGFRNQLKPQHLPKNRQRRRPHTAERKASNCQYHTETQSRRGNPILCSPCLSVPTAKKQPDHAALLVAFCAAITPLSARSSRPKAAVTPRLIAVPGCAFGSRSVEFNSAIEYVSGLIHMITRITPVAVAIGNS